MIILSINRTTGTSSDGTSIINLMGSPPQWE
jgi:hypothetical protein